MNDNRDRIRRWALRAMRYQIYAAIIVAVLYTTGALVGLW
jgi:hypothetical protein